MANYVDNKKLYEAFVKYRNSDDVQEFLLRKKNHKKGKKDGLIEGRFKEAPPKLPEIIGKAIYDTAHGYARKKNFNHLSYADEMISDAMIHCVSYIYNFNPEITKNPFAYITQSVGNAFLQRIDKEKQVEEGKREIIKGIHNGQIDSVVHAKHADNVHVVTDFVRNAVKVIDEIEEMNQQNGIK